MQKEHINNKDIINLLNDTLKKCVYKVLDLNDNITQICSIEDSLTFSHGDPGVLLLLSELKRNNIFSFDGNIKKVISRMLENIYKAPINISLFGGITGIAFSINSLSMIDSSYEKILNQIDSLILNIIGNMEFDQSLPLRAQDYDTMMGLSGIGRYLLMRSELVENSDEYREKILKILVHFKNIHNNPHPGKLPWWISNKQQFIEEDRKIYLEGNYNLGLAHGVLGPFSLMSLAYLKEVRISGHKELLISMKNYILNFKTINKNGFPVFPDRVDAGKLENFRNQDIDKFCKNGWCYGNPGVANTLFLMGKALGDNEVTSIAKSVIDGIISEKNDDLTSPILCHGKAGLVSILLSIYDNKFYVCSKLNDYIKEITLEICNSYSDDSKYGFYDIEKSNKTLYKFCKHGLLEGTSGILLALINCLGHYNNELRVKTYWQKSFLLN